MLPELKTISGKALKRGKEIVAEAPQHDENWVDEQVALMVKEEFGLMIYSIIPLPTKPPLLEDYLKLLYRDRLKKTDAHSEKCRIYLATVRRVNLDNESSVRTLEKQLIPAFQRLGMTSEEEICRGLLNEHRSQFTEPQTMSFDEMEKRYGE